MNLNILVFRPLGQCLYCRSYRVAGNGKSISEGGRKKNRKFNFDQTEPMLFQ